MLLMSYYVIMAMVMSMLVLFASQVLAAKFNSSRNKNSPFECGFDPKDSARLPFSIRFFLLAVIFLIFDIEVALLFPTILGIKMKMIKITYFASTLFLIILMMGLIHEWHQGSLSWIY